MAHQLTEVARRPAELAAAAAIGLMGLVVAVESLSHDVGWNPTGPGPGYFPFRVGLFVTAASVVLFVRSWRSRAVAVFATTVELRRSASVFWPTVCLVAAMFMFGCYVPSVVYLAWMMRAHGRYGWSRSAVVAAALMVAFYVVFEVWFQVPLAKGPVEAALGID